MTRAEWVIEEKEKEAKRHAEFIANQEREKKEKQEIKEERHQADMDAEQRHKAMAKELNQKHRDGKFMNGKKRK